MNQSLRNPNLQTRREYNNEMLDLYDAKLYGTTKAEQDELRRLGVNLYDSVPVYFTWDDWNDLITGKIDNILIPSYDRRSMPISIKSDHIVPTTLDMLCNINSKFCMANVVPPDSHILISIYKQDKGYDYRNARMLLHPIDRGNGLMQIEFFLLDNLHYIPYTNLIVGMDQ